MVWFSIQEMSIALHITFVENDQTYYLCVEPYTRWTLLYLFVNWQFT